MFYCKKNGLGFFFGPASVGSALKDMTVKTSEAVSSRHICSGKNSSSMESESKPHGTAPDIKHESEKSSILLRIRLFLGSWELLVMFLTIAREC